MPNYCEKSCLLCICSALFTAASVAPYVDDMATVEIELSRGPQVAGAEGWEAWPHSAEAGLWTMTSLMTSPLAIEKRLEWSNTPASCGVQTMLDELPGTDDADQREHACQSTSLCGNNYCEWTFRDRNSSTPDRKAWVCSARQGWARSASAINRPRE